MNAKKFAIPNHVFGPGKVEDFIPLSQHKFTYRAGLGYATLRALGANENLGESELEILASWSTKYGRENNKATPSIDNLVARSFRERVSAKWSAHLAAKNASCYPGRAGGRPSYADIFREVWVEQRWPELCLALTERHNSGASKK